MQLIVGLSGATGVIYGIRLLEVLHRLNDIETHLIMTSTAKQTIVYETDYTVAQVSTLASVVYDNRDVGAALASGSFRTDGMVIVPCSIKTLSGIAHSYAENLLVQAADVTLKESRRLVLAVRETPLHLGHLRLMTSVVEYGAVLMPPMPAFYTRPQTLDDLINQTVGRLLDQFAIETDLILFSQKNVTIIFWQFNLASCLFIVTFLIQNSIISRWQGLREGLQAKRDK